MSRLGVLSIKLLYTFTNGFHLAINIISLGNIPTSELSMYYKHVLGLVINCQFSKMFVPFCI